MEKIMKVLSYCFKSVGEMIDLIKDIKRFRGYTDKKEFIHHLANIFRYLFIAVPTAVLICVFVPIFGWFGMIILAFAHAILCMLLIPAYFILCIRRLRDIGLRSPAILMFFISFILMVKYFEVIGFFMFLIIITSVCLIDSDVLR